LLAFSTCPPLLFSDSCCVTYAAQAFWIHF
jgi:hypothetical protein